MLNRLFLAAGAALLAAGPALAAGIGEPMITPAPVAPVIVPPALVLPNGDWGGFYAGGQLGFGTLHLERFEDDFDDIDDIFDTDFDGTLLGLHAGYQYDFGLFVAGAEVDYDWTDIDVDPLDTGAGIEADAISRFKLRAGYDADRFQPYVTAGWASANLASATDDAIDGTTDGSFWGAGVAYAVGERFLVGGEYLTHSFEDSPFESRDFDISTFTLRGSFRF